jgi:molybdenum cofactor cytidylyltransferase
VAVVAAVVLAAGFGRRFGSQKLVAPLEGRPILQHVLDRLAEADIPNPIVVVPPDASALDGSIAWRDAQRVANPEPGRGLSSSLREGWAAALARTPRPDAVIIALGDQPRVSADLLRSLRAAPLDASRPFVVPRYAAGGGGNPVRVEASATALVEEVAGDRGLGPLIAARPDLVRLLAVKGENPDVDTAADLDGLGGSAGGPSAPPKPRP